MTLNADVQGWVNNPSSNLGWILTGDELVNQTIRQFSSSEALTASLRPTLTIDYTPAAVPEPSSLVLAAMGVALGTRLARRRRNDGSSAQAST